MPPRKKSAGQGADRTPPNSIEAERSVLGAMLLNPDAVGAAIEILRDDPEDIFYLEAHRHIYRAMIALFRDSVPVDVVTLLERLQRESTLEAAGGVSYLSELTGAVPTSANVQYYARIVLDAALRRRLISVCANITSSAYQSPEDVNQLLDEAEGAIFRLAEKRQMHPIYRVSDLLAGAITRIEKLKKDGTGISGLPSGFRELDNLLSGFQPSDMIVLAARPSVGKTAFALNIASNAAVRLKKKVLIFSVEMPREQLMMRLLCMEGGLNLKKLQSGYMADGEFQKLPQAADALAQAPLFIDDTPGIGVLDLRSKARRQMAQHGIDLIIIDYLQLMYGMGRPESRQVEIAEISRSIKGLARELGVPIIALSQVSREAAKDESGVPKLHHLRESGAIEQDADVVMMLGRPSEKDREGRENVVCLRIEKHRNGPTGYLELFFDANLQRFRSLGHDSPNVVPYPVRGGADPADVPYDWSEPIEEEDPLA